jgi:hypothetical protein
VTGQVAKNRRSRSRTPFFGTPGREASAFIEIQGPGRAEKWDFARRHGSVLKSLCVFAANAKNGALLVSISGCSEICDHAVMRADRARFRFETVLFRVHFDILMVFG